MPKVFFFLKNLRISEKSSTFALGFENYRASPIRPAPSEFPQVLIEARVGGCSGAM